MSLKQLLLTLKGGPGSGNFGHSGRLGKRGGSAPSRSFSGLNLFDSLNKSFDYISQDTGLSKDKIAELIGIWNRSANNPTDPNTMQFQRVTGKIFGVPLSDYQKSLKPSSNTGTLLNDSDLEKVLRSMHQNTQSYLKEKGIKSVLLYRGIRGEQTQRNPLESWSDNSFTPLMYGGNVQTREIPAKDILSFYGTGFGGLNEYVIIGKD